MKKMYSELSPYLAILTLIATAVLAVAGGLVAGVVIVAMSNQFSNLLATVATLTGVCIGETASFFVEKTIKVRRLHIDSLCRTFPANMEKELRRKFPSVRMTFTHGQDDLNRHLAERASRFRVFRVLHRRVKKFYRERSSYYLLFLIRIAIPMLVVSFGYMLYALLKVHLTLVHYCLLALLMYITSKLTKWALVTLFHADALPSKA